MNYEFLLTVMFFIIFISIQLTLNKIVLLLKEINLKIEYMLRIENKDENKI